MRLIDETSLVCDSDGLEWECRWMRLDGSPIPKITRVRLRRPGSDTDTHYLDGPWTADAFQPGLIHWDFVALKL